MTAGFYPTMSMCRIKIPVSVSPVPARTQRR